MAEPQKYKQERILQIIPPTPGFVALYVGSAEGETFTTPAACLALVERWGDQRHVSLPPALAEREVVPMAASDGGLEACDLSMNYRGYFSTDEARAIINDEAERLTPPPRQA